MVPSSWGYGTFHQNNPLYINMVKQGAAPASHSISSVSAVSLLIFSNLINLAKDLRQQKLPKLQLKITSKHLSNKNKCSKQIKM
jgi:hypothetical protein